MPSQKIDIPHGSGPLLPLPDNCVIGTFAERHKRFCVRLHYGDHDLWVHSNNTGSMLGLLRPGTPVLASPADHPHRKLKYTQECVWLEARAVPATSCAAPDAPEESSGCGFWVGVNTGVPNRLLEAAFHAGRLPFAAGYDNLTREARRRDSRLDGLFTGPKLPPLWVECKNVTLVEDDVALFPDAASERGKKHLRDLMDIVTHGERAAMFYLVQRPDGRCFAPADVIDPEYAVLFWEAHAAGVEMYPFRALVSLNGTDLGEPLPLRDRPKIGDRRKHAR